MMLLDGRRCTSHYTETGLARAHIKKPQVDPPLSGVFAYI